MDTGRGLRPSSAEGWCGAEWPSDMGTDMRRGLLSLAEGVVIWMWIQADK